MAELLLRMVAGSRLYGTDRPDSDFDTYEIWDHCRPTHKHGETEDRTCWPLSMFMSVAMKGGHNALDLMFAPSGWPSVDLIADLRASFVADPYLCRPRFLKTMLALAERGDAKGWAHAERLMSNLHDLERTGRYDPRWRLTERNTFCSLEGTKERTTMTITTEVAEATYPAEKVQTYLKGQRTLLVIEINEIKNRIMLAEHPEFGTGEKTDATRASLQMAQGSLVTLDMITKHLDTKWGEK